MGVNLIRIFLFIPGSTTNEEFEAMMSSMKAPMVELEIPGSIIFTIPTKTVTEVIKDMSALADKWYEIIEDIQWLIGYRFPRPMRYVTDIQISIGAAHSGYPIMRQTLPTYMFDLNYLRSGEGWGVYHEIGHNLQESRWGPSGTGEVTCNIFPVMVNNKVFKKDYSSSFAYSAEHFRNGGQTLQALKKRNWNHVASFVGPHLDFGWVPFAETFAEYLKLPKTLNPNTDEGKYSTWAKLMSLKTGHNLIPYFQWWAWPINQEAIYATKHLPDWDMVEKLKDKKCRSQLKIFRNNPQNYLAFFNFIYLQCWMNGCRVNLIKLALLMLVSQPKKVKKNVPNVSSPSSSKDTLMINVPQLLPPNFGVQL